MNADDFRTATLCSGLTTRNRSVVPGLGTFSTGTFTRPPIDPTTDADPSPAL